jgi:hypothetical protein
MGPLSSPESHVSSHMGHMTTYRSSYIDFWEQYDFYFWFFHRLQSACNEQLPHCHSSSHKLAFLLRPLMFPL